MPDLDLVMRGFEGGLLAAERPSKRIPQLPENPAGGEWCENAERLWRSVWRAVDVHPGEVHALIRLLCLVQLFESQPSEELSEEIRLLARQFGRSSV